MKPLENVIEPDYIPQRQTKESAGYDIVSPNEYDLVAGEYVVIDTGVKFTSSAKVMDSSKFVALVLPRSSYGFKYGLRFKNTVAVIDMDYRDTIKLCVTVDNNMKLHKGERFAQMILVPYTTFCGEAIPYVERTGGIGSTGTRQQTFM